MAIKLKLLTKYNKLSSKKLLRLILFVSSSAYIIYHLLQGNRGFLAWLKIRQVIKYEQEVLKQVTSDVNTLSRKVKLLRPQSLDTDLLEERVRDILNMASTDEVIVRMTK
ncbi:MAG: septum formation initiator family protein [Holosporales bacterium]|jgi:cell division protein FtsB|nr:septum formation initiator family protein [Holosporales bacterium]